MTARKAQTRAFRALNREDLTVAMKETASDFVFDFSRSRSFERGVYGRDDVPALQSTFAGAWDRCGRSRKSSSRQGINS